MKPIITVEGVSKRYVIGKKESYGSLRDEVMDALSSPFRRFLGSTKVAEDPSIWALKDVSFQVFKGDVLGIIGRNGAGKSTLLKILSRITEPTEGRIEMRGRIASLLEVGTGFHPELTGRENIFMNGALLGMSNSEIRTKFDEIVAFSEIEKFLDTPVKRYSSGMYVKLAFSVAAHLEPEILIVDEVLAVGDASFQKKCLGKMGSIAKGGRTVLLVSHNMATINSLCSRAVILENGTVGFDGVPADAVRHYLEGERGGASSGFVEFPEDESSQIQIKSIAARDANGNISTVFDYSEGCKFDLSIELRKKDIDYYACIAVNDIFGNLVFFTADDDLVESRLSNAEKGEYVYAVDFPSKLLKPGEYLITFSLNRRLHGPSELFSTYSIRLEIQDNRSRRGMKNAYRPAVVAPEIPWMFRTMA